jgi:YidC/Oxa1 family membrane protein insertase
MDKRSIIGLLIIGAILFAFSYFSAEKPTDDNTTRTEKNDSTGQVVDSEPNVLDSNLVADNIAAPVVSHLVPTLNDTGYHLTNNVGQYQYKDTVTGLDTFLTQKIEILVPLEIIPTAEEKIVRIENDVVIIDISNKGGRIVSVSLKDYKTYDSFMSEEDKALQLFDKESTYGIDFFEGDKKFNTADYDFKFKATAANSATVEMINPSGKKVIYSYELEEGKYDVDFNISFVGFSDKDADDIAFISDFKLLSTEKHLPSEQRVSTLFYKYEEGSYDYLSIGGDDEEILEESTQWVAYKQSYFSAVLMSKTGFKPTNGSKIEVLNLDENDSTYIKQYKSKLDLGITNMSNTVELEWYFGPNDYDELATYENGCEDIVELGWGFF